MQCSKAIESNDDSIPEIAIESKYIASGKKLNLRLSRTRISIAHNDIFAASTAGIKRFPIRSKHLKNSGGFKCTFSIDCATISLLWLSRASKLLQIIREIAAMSHLR